MLLFGKISLKGGFADEEVEAVSIFVSNFGAVVILFSKSFPDPTDTKPDNRLGKQS